MTGGVTHLLPLALGYQRAMELLLLGERQSADRLLDLGLVNVVVARAELEAKGMEMAARVPERAPSSGRAVELEQAATIEAFHRPEVAARVARFSKRKRSG